MSKSKEEIIQEASFQVYYSMANQLKSQGNWSDASLYYGLHTSIAMMKNKKEIENRIQSMMPLKIFFM